MSLPLIRARLQWWLHRWASSSTAGPMLLLCSLALLLPVVFWHSHVSERWRADQALSLAGSRVPAAAPRSASAERRAALEAFYGALPTPDELPELLQSMIVLADQLDLRLMRGSYRLEPEVQTQMARYRMTLPLRGDPRKVQQMVQAALLAHAALAIESIQYKRDPADGGVLEAQVQWVVYVRTASSRPATTAQNPPRASARSADGKRS